MLTRKRFALTTRKLARDGAVRHGWITVVLIVLFEFSPYAFSSTLVITSGTFTLGRSREAWSFAGDGFSAFGSDDSFSTVLCGFCSAPFQLVNPLPIPTFSPVGGNFTVGGKSYILPDLVFMGTSPWAISSVFLSPQGALPTVPGAGTYDVPFTVGGSFCVTDDPNVPPPHFDMSNPACFSVIGAAIAHYTVVAINGPNAFFQPLPTIEIVPTPEPSTLGAGMLGILLIFAVRRSRMLTRIRAVSGHRRRD